MLGLPNLSKRTYFCIHLLDTEVVCYSGHAEVRGQLVHWGLILGSQDLALFRKIK